jgi:DNA-binding SARP family transcriptional activator/tetratricopeptide (TPR) repeat protein
VVQIRLLALGGQAAVSGDGTPVPWLARQTKLFTLLVYVSFQEPRWVSLETILELFWPEADAAHARKAFNQLMHSARNELGRDVLERQGPSLIRLSSTVSCDAAEVLAGRSSSDLVKLASLELLPGVSGSAGFLHWLDGARASLCRHLVAELTSPSAPTDAATQCIRARAALTLDPGSGSAALQLVRALDSVGATTEVWRFFEEHRTRLRDDFDLPVPPELAREVLRICGSAAQVAATSETTATPATSAAVPSNAASTHASPADDAATPSIDAAASPLRPPLAARRFVTPAIAAAAFLLCASAAYLLWLRPGPALGRDLWAAELLVEEPAGQSAWAQGVAPLLSHRLAERGMTLVHAPAYSRQDVPFFVRGRVAAAYDAITGVVQLHDARNAALVASWKLETTAAALDGDVASIADSVRVIIGRRMAVDVIRGGRVPAAVDALVAARTRYDAALIASRSGASALAESGLAAADSQAQVAMRLDARWAQPHLLRGLVLEQQALRAVGQRDDAVAKRLVSDAVSEATRALEQGEDHAARELRGKLYYFAWALDALPHALRLAERDLTTVVASGRASPRTWSALSGVHHASGRMNDAYAAAERALSMDVFGANSESALLRLHNAALDAGRREDARRWCVELKRITPGRWPGSWCELQGLAATRKTAASQRISAAEILAAPVDLSREAPESAALMRDRFTAMRAAVLASNAHTAEARAVLASVNVEASADLELYHYTARAYAQMGEYDVAREHLARFLARSGPAARSVVHSWWLAPLREHAGGASALLTAAGYRGSTTSPR